MKTVKSKAELEGLGLIKRDEGGVMFELKGSGWQVNVAARGISCCLSWSSFSNPRHKNSITLISHNKIQAGVIALRLFPKGGLGPELPAH